MPPSKPCLLSINDEYLKNPDIYQPMVPNTGIQDLSQHQTFPSDKIVVTTTDGQRTMYRLRGVMYHLEDHFTLRFITESGSVWYHDGMSTGQQMENEGNFVDMIDIGTC
jgi:hypothetical protein